MPSRGSAWTTPPAPAAAPGMPKCSEVARSCASTVPPARCTRREPAAPSTPRPVSTTATMGTPASASESSSTSAEGRENWMGGVSVSDSVPPAAMRRCRPEGATYTVPARSTAPSTASHTGRRVRPSRMCAR